MPKPSDPKKPAKAAAKPEATAAHSSQSEVAKRALEKLKSAKGGVAVPGVPQKKPGFDPSQIKGAGKAFGGGGNQMLRRTQGKGGGGGGGAGGGGGGNV